MDLALVSKDRISFPKALLPYKRSQISMGYSTNPDVLFKDLAPGLGGNREHPCRNNTFRASTLPFNTAQCTGVLNHL